MSNDFINTTPFNIPDDNGSVPGLAVSTINVNNAHFIVTDILFEIVLSHSFPDDLDMVLVAPDGVHNLVFWSDAGGNSGSPLSHTPVGISDTFGTTPLPDNTQITSVGFYKPTNWGPSAETPAEFGLDASVTLNNALPTGGATFGSIFGGINTSGTWTLRIADDANLDTGSVDRWALIFIGTSVALTNNDTNANGRSDIIWRDASGRLATWDMNGAAITSGSFVTSGGVAVAPGSSWTVAGISDFSGDDKSDVLWRSTTGQLAVWILDGSTITGSNEITSAGATVRPDSTWNIVATGDFAGADGKADILWRSTSNQLVLWQMDGSAITSSGEITSSGAVVRPDASWSVAGVGDFRNDTTTDILWRSTSGEIALWQMNGLSPGSLLSSNDVTSGGAAVRLDVSWSVAGIGDFNSDGEADILWRNGTTNELALWEMNGSVISASGDLMSGGVAVSPDATWHVVEIGDFNGDHNSDILWRNDNGAMAEWLMNGTAVTTSVTPNLGGTAVSPDATWTTQAKPTNFG